MDLMSEFGIESMPVHVTNPTEVAYAHTHKDSCLYRPTFHTFLLLPAGAGTPVEGTNYIKIAAFSPSKRRITITVSAASGGAAFGQAVICHSVGAATQVAGQTTNAVSQDIPGYVLWGSRNSVTTLTLESQSDLWAAVGSDSAVNGSLISIAEEFEEQ